MTCTRYRADGNRCGRPTENGDGWCRTQGCEGYRTGSRPDGDDEDGAVGSRPARTWVRVESAEPAPEGAEGPCVAPEEAYEVSVTRTAQEKFVGVHGGTMANAETELRSMLEDFLRARVWSRSRVGDRWLLRQDGYMLVLSNDGTVVNYSTVHAERSWSQFKSGVPSRFAGAKAARQEARRMARDRPLTGEPIGEEQLRALDLDTLAMPGWRLHDFRRACRKGLLPPMAPYQEVLAQDLRSGRMELKDLDGHPAWVVHGGVIRWTIRADGLMLLAASVWAGIPATVRAPK